MDARQALAQYRAILETTRRMLAAAQAGHWDVLIELERARRAAVDALTSTDLDFGACAAEKDACIHAIVEADQEITRLSQTWMAEMQDILATLRAQRQLAVAYQSAPGGWQASP
ncbi:flagellar protein FliT [Thiobacter aerophilum]|uniref:Flagellar protein FliT n=1 Tax=Thiobacter aerophilum TaxID=3121275 RepID=A0ABV0EB31_9BURK